MDRERKFSAARRESRSIRHGSAFATSESLDTHQESAVILWHDLNFWTAAGQLGIGVMAGMAIGIILKRMRRTSRTSARRDGRMCPRCGAPSLQRVHGATAQGALGVISGHSAYVCARCHWPASGRRKNIRIASEAIGQVGASRSSRKTCSRNARSRNARSRKAPKSSR